MGNETTATETAAAPTGPSASKLKKALRAVLEEAKYSPNLTMGQVRAHTRKGLSRSREWGGWWWLTSHQFQLQYKGIVEIEAIVVEHLVDD